MLLELAKPVTLLASMISLLAVFHAAFFGAQTDIYQRIYDSLAMLLLAAGISLLSGLAFRENPGGENLGRESLHATPRPTLARTFPIQLFLWTIGILLVLFFVAWYLETHIIFEPSRHW